jgi:hypothetical protein
VLLTLIGRHFIRRRVAELQNVLHQLMKFSAELGVTLRDV